MQLSRELKEAIDNNAFCAISTHLNDREIQTHLMWIDYQDNCILINTEKDRKKTENIRNNSNISLVVFIQQQCIPVGRLGEKWQK